ncbi:hypothetical protein L195_g033989, partial [Trifolium pratense]
MAATSYSFAQSAPVTPTTVSVPRAVISITKTPSRNFVKVLLVVDVVLAYNRVLLDVNVVSDTVGWDVIHGKPQLNEFSSCIGMPRAFLVFRII